MLTLLQLAPLGGGMFLGWSLGANNAANIFGTAVAARIVTFRKACLLCGAAVILGALLQGQAGIGTLSGLTVQTRTSLIIIPLSAAVTTTIMTIMRLPISTSQAVVGAIAGVAFAARQMNNWPGLEKVLICWIATPLGAVVSAALIYKILAEIIRRVPMSMLTRDKILWTGLLLVGVYGAYALGANNVANVTGIFAGQIPHLNDRHLALLGGIAITVGVFTYSKGMMLAVGSGIMPLDAFTAFVAVAAMAVTVHVFAVVGVPVSTSQAIVGAIIGIGLIRGVNAIHFKVLRNIAFGWILTPAVSLILAAAAHAIFSTPQT